MTDNGIVEELTIGTKVLARPVGKGSRKAMTAPIHRRKSQRANLSVTLVGYLILVCIGFAGCTLCVRNDGELLGCFKYAHSKCCLPRPLCTLSSECASGDLNFKSHADRSGDCCRCCNEIPLAMICVTRFSASYQTANRAEDSGLSARTKAIFAFHRKLHGFERSHLSALHPSLSSLKCTVLLI